jgi:hypothetical protein
MRTPGSVRRAAGNGGPYRHPSVWCPSCQAWSEREAWTTTPGQVFPLRISCPRGDAEADVSDLDYRLYDPTRGILEVPPNARPPSRGDDRLVD